MPAELQHRSVLISRLDPMNKKILSCVFLFILTVSLQKMIAFVAPLDGNFGKYVVAASLYSQAKLDPERVTDFSPFYFELHLALFRWLGSYESCLILLQIAAAGLSVIAFYLIASKYISHWAAMVGALVLPLTSGFAVLTRVFVPDIWFLTFLLFGILFLVVYLTENNPVVPLLLSGFFFGLGLFTRPTALLYVPFAFLAMILARKKHFVQSSCIFLFTFLAFLALFLLRNQSYTGKFTLTVMDPGGVFFEGNNPYSDGNGVNTPLIKELEGQYLDQPSAAQAFLKRIPSAIRGRKMDAAESNSYWQRKALHYIRDHPGSYLRLMLRKVYRLFQSQEVHDVYPALLLSGTLREKHFPLVPTSMIVTLALLGLYVKRVEWKHLLILYSGFLIGCSVPLITFVSNRYRLPLMPFLLFFSCGALEYLVAEYRAGRVRKFAVFAGMSLLLIAALDWPVEKGKRPDDVWISIKKAHAFQVSGANLRNAGKRNSAADHIAAAISAAPSLQETLILANLPYRGGSPVEQAIAMKRRACQSSLTDDCYFDLGLLLLESGKFAEARKIFELLASSGEAFRRWYLCSPYPEYYLGRIEGCQEGKWNEAVQRYRNVLQDSPGEPDTLAGLTVALEKTGKGQEAENTRRDLFRYFDEADAMFFLGKSYWYAKDYQQSAKCFEQVVKWVPDYRKARIYSAAALGQAGRIDDAVREYWKATTQKEDPLLLQEPILTIFRKNANKLKTSHAYYAYGVVLRQFGQFEEAYQIQTLVLELEPNFTPAAIELKGLSSIFSSRSGGRGASSRQIQQ